MHNLQYFEQLQDVMLQSGQLLMQYFNTNCAVFEKDGYSIFTLADIENEKFLKSELVKIYPNAGFCAEESGYSQAQSDWMWVIDPLDGTKNFVKGIPHFCSMVALTYKNRVMVSAIYLPAMQQFYYAEQGKGLWLNGKKIEFVDRLIQQKFAIIDCNAQIKLKLKENNLQISRRYFGSAGIDAVYLATGAIDLIAFQDIAWWDVAAGILIIQESRGLVCNYTKSLKKDGYGTLIAGNKIFFEDF